MGRDKRNEDRTEHWTKLVRPMMQTDAWRVLSTTAQALYPWIKFEWHGPKANNNGRLRLSVRRAAQCLGCARNTAARAFIDLQAKGFLVVRKQARLGVDGQATSPEYEITELGLPPGYNVDPDDNDSDPWEKPYGRKLYENWSKGRDYPVKPSLANNPTGSNGKRQISDGVVVPLKRRRPKK